MANINKIIFGGRLCADPELKFFDSGSCVANCRVVSNFRTKNAQKEWIDGATFMGAKIHGPQAKAFVKHHQKGSLVLFDGELRTDDWADKKTGKRRSVTYIRVDNWHFQDEGKRQQSSGNQQSEPLDTYTRPFPADIDDTPF